jgi:energy-coupling factor transporter ATP-binding protein EcfA2
MNPSSRTARIAAILQQRRPLAEKIATVARHLHALASSLQHLEQQRDRLLAQVEDETLLGRLQDLDCKTLQQTLESELASLQKLQRRCDRNTLNIGVIGRAGQGKSRLLQSLSGLTTAEIPTGDRQHCTGVRSTIYHNPNIEPYGEVTFHSEQSFLNEILAPYYTKLNLGLRPFSLDEFAVAPLPPLPSDLSRQAEFGAMYEHLRRYRTHLNEYRPLLQNLSPRRIARSEIREYVAQDNSQGDRVYFNYLAVREAKIVCTFPQSDVGQIALIDMPGLGDTGLGDEERLIQTLGQEVDIVLFLRLPRPPRDYWADVDVQLYDIASSALNELPLKRWSFLILNRTTADSPIGDNAPYCADLAQTHAEKHLSVAGCILANCANFQEARDRILDPVLNYLASEIQALDREYTSSAQERLFQLQNAVELELNKAGQIFARAAVPSHEFPLFVQLFDRLWDDFTTGLERLLEDLREQRNLQDEDFKEQVEKALQACRDDPGIPSEAEIETRRDRAGGYPNAYYQYLNEIRAHLSQHFLSLDEGLKRGLDRVRSQVAEVLIGAGSLGNLTEARGPEFLNVLAELIPDEFFPGQPSALKLGVQILALFELSYRGLIQHRIRQHFDDLTPDETSLQLSTSPSAKEVLTCLQSLQAEAVYRCETALDDFLAEPSQAAFAIVEEFLDRVLRAKDVKNEWRIFFQEVRAEVWPEEFKQLGEKTRSRQNWLDSVERATLANDLKNLKFLE